MKKQSVILGAALLGLAAFSGPVLAADAAMPTISDAHIVLGSGKIPTVAYFKLHNGTGQRMALTDLRASLASGVNDVKIHVAKQGKNPEAPMEYLDIVELPAGQSIDFSQNGPYFVLGKSAKALKAGDEVPIDLGYDYGTRPWQTVKFKVENGKST